MLIEACVLPQHILMTSSVRRLFAVNYVAREILPLGNRNQVLDMLKPGFVFNFVAYWWVVTVPGSLWSFGQVFYSEQAFRWYGGNNTSAEAYGRREGIIEKGA